MIDSAISRRNLLKAGACTLAGTSGLLCTANALDWKKEDSAVVAKDKVIRDYYSGWEKKDWSAVESQLADGFTFTSPNNDDHIDVSRFKARCWPTAVWVERFELESVFVRGNEAFVKYLCRTKSGKSFRNVEYLQFAGGKVKSIQVFFGEPQAFAKQ
jgi:hypothetical protein